MVPQAAVGLTGVRGSVSKLSKGNDNVNYKSSEVIYYWLDAPDQFWVNLHSQIQT